MSDEGCLEGAWCPEGAGRVVGVLRIPGGGCCLDCIRRVAGVRMVFGGWLLSGFCMEGGQCPEGCVCSYSKEYRKW